MKKGLVSVFTALFIAIFLCACGNSSVSSYDLPITNSTPLTSTTCTVPASITPVSLEDRLPGVWHTIAPVYSSYYDCEVVSTFFFWDDGTYVKVLYSPNGPDLRREYGVWEIIGDELYTELRPGGDDYYYQLGEGTVYTYNGTKIALGSLVWTRTGD